MHGTPALPFDMAAPIVVLLSAALKTSIVADFDIHNTCHPRTL